MIKDTHESYCGQHPPFWVFQTQRFQNLINFHYHMQRKKSSCSAGYVRKSWFWLLDTESSVGHHQEMRTEKLKCWWHLTSTNLELLCVQWQRLALPNNTWEGTFPSLHLVMETDQVSKMLFLKKNTLDIVQNNSHVYCYTQSSEIFRLRYNWRVFKKQNVINVLNVIMKMLYICGFKLRCLEFLECFNFLCIRCGKL
jgi:hypothetical protein